MFPGRQSFLELEQRRDTRSRARRLRGRPLSPADIEQTEPVPQIRRFLRLRDDSCCTERRQENIDIPANKTFQ
jgi:hypothetical protein